MRYLIFTAIAMLIACGQPKNQHSDTNTCKSDSIITVNILDSLHPEPECGDIVHRQFVGILPAASGPGIEYTLTIYNQMHSGDGVYCLTLNYLEAENGKDAKFTTYGRRYTLRGDATDMNSVVYQLVPYNNNEQEVNLLLLPNGDLELLNSKLERAESQLNYTLKLISETQKPI